MVKSKKYSRIEEIVFISPGLLEPATLRGGGIEEIDYQIGRELSNKGLRVSLLGPYYKKHPKKVKNNNGLIIKYLPFPATHQYPPNSIGRQIIQTAIIKPFLGILVFITLLRPETERGRILILHNGAIGFAGTIAGKLTGSRIILSEGNVYPWAKQVGITSGKKQFLQKVAILLNLSLGKMIAQLSDSIRVQSRGIKNDMENNMIDGGKIVVISGGVDTQAIKPKSKEGDDPILNIGFIGRLTHEKGAVLLRDIILAVNTSKPNIRFIILGDGPIRRDIEEMPNVSHIGFVPRDTLNDWLSMFEIALFFQKDIGLAEIEAMSAGKAIIACNLVSSEGILIHNHNAVLCDPNIKDYLRGIDRLINDDNLRKKISTEARNDAILEFGWNCIGNEWIDLISKIQGEC